MAEPKLSIVQPVTSRPRPERTDEPRPAEASRVAQQASSAFPPREPWLDRLVRRVRDPKFVVSAAAVVLLLVGITFVVTQPMNLWSQQKRDISESQERLDAVKAERVRVQAETARLRSEASVEQRAREQFDMTRPGEDLYVVLPTPTEDLGLPESWPFTGVERELGAG